MSAEWDKLIQEEMELTQPWVVGVCRICGRHVWEPPDGPRLCDRCSEDKEAV